MSTDSVVHAAEAASSKGKVPAQSRRERVIMEEDLDLEMLTDSVVSTAEAAASKGKAPAGSTRGRTALSTEPTTACTSIDDLDSSASLATIPSSSKGKTPIRTVEDAVTNETSTDVRAHAVSGSTLHGVPRHVFAQKSNTSRVYIDPLHYPSFS